MAHLKPQTETENCEEPLVESLAWVCAIQNRRGTTLNLRQMKTCEIYCQLGREASPKTWPAKHELGLFHWNQEELVLVKVLYLYSLSWQLIPETALQD